LTMRSAALKRVDRATNFMIAAKEEEGPGWRLLG
jgi:hypothetical protein